MRPAWPGPEAVKGPEQEAEAEAEAEAGFAFAFAKRNSDWRKSAAPPTRLAKLFQYKIHCILLCSSSGSILLDSVK